MFHLPHMLHSLPEIPQQPEFPSEEVCVLMDWDHWRNWHQRENMIMIWHRAALGCLAWNKRYLKPLELSAEHLTGRNPKPLCWQLSVYISISSSCPGFIPRGPFHKLTALPIILSKILAHLGTLTEAQIGLEPLQLPNLFNMQKSQ